MANTDLPQGFLPRNDDAPCHKHKVSSSNSTAILRGAPVTKNSDGYIVNATAGAGNLILGIAADYVPALTASDIMVWDDKDTIFVAQEDGVGTTSAQTHEGNNVDFISTHTSANGVDSATELDMSSVTTGATAQFRIEGLAAQIDPGSGAANAWGANAKLLVKINYHQGHSTTGV